MVRLAYRGTGWSDPGEEQVLASLLPLPAGSRVLDLGIGGGRTTAFLADAGDSYLGLDVTPEMVADARARFPGADLRVGDAADLSGFADASFDLVVFSLNGVDCLDHQVRSRFLEESARVLSDGGALVFSTHNLEGPSFGERPSLRDARDRWARPGLALKAEAVLGAVPRLLLAHRHFRRHAADQPRGQGWAMAPLRAHEFRFVTHFATLAEARASVQRAGLVVEAVWGSSGRAIPSDAASHDDHYAHLLCRKPLPTG